jgi:hypothetical protein
MVSRDPGSLEKVRRTVSMFDPEVAEIVEVLRH